MSEVILVPRSKGLLSEPSRRTALKAAAATALSFPTLAACGFLHDPADDIVRGPHQPFSDALHALAEGTSTRFQIADVVDWQWTHVHLFNYSSTGDEINEAAGMRVATPGQTLYSNGMMIMLVFHLDGVTTAAINDAHPWLDTELPPDELGIRTYVELHDDRGFAFVDPG